MGETETEIVREIEISKPADIHQTLELDVRGRVTIPASVRSRHNIDAKDDKEYWVEMELKKIEVRKQTESEGSDS